MKATDRDYKLIEKAMVARERGDYRCAIRIWTNLMRRHRKSVLYHERGTMFSKCGEFDKAIDDLTIAIQLDPDDSDCNVNRGNAFLLKEQYESAVDDYDMAISLSPRAKQAFNGRGCAHEFSRRFDAAVADYTTAMLLDDNYLGPVFNLATLYMKMGESERAKHLLARARTLAPEDDRVVQACIDLHRRTDANVAGDGLLE